MREDSPRCRACKGSHKIITTSKQESAKWGPTNPSLFAAGSLRIRVPRAR